MSKIDEIRAQMVVAMKEKDKEKKDSLSMLVSALKNKEGTKAQIEILRDGEVINLEVERREVKINHIESEIL